MTSYLYPLFSLLATATLTLSAQKESAPIPQRWTVNVDFLDQTVYAPSYGIEDWNREEIARMYQHYAGLGINRVFWRISATGVVTYPSKVRTPIRKSDEESHQHILRQLERGDDPLAIGIEEGRKAGIEVYVWITLFDDYGHEAGGQYASDFVLKNPQYQWTSKDGKPFFGVLSYSYPEVREHRLAEIREVLERNPDGIYLCTRTHSFFHACDTGDDYGYEPPVRDEYLRRYHLDILKTDKFDRQAWRNLRAEGLDRFIRDASKMIQGQGKKLAFGVKSLSNQDMGWPYGNAVLPWHSWVKDGVVDEIVSGHFFPTLSTLISQQAAFRAIPGHESVRTTLWIQLYHYEKNELIPSSQLIQTMRQLVRDGFNGGAFHQGDNLLGGELKPEHVRIANTIRDVLKPSASEGTPKNAAATKPEEK